MQRLPAFFSPRLSAKVRPQDDFYRYANEAWIKANPMPRTHSAWSTFDLVHDRVQHQLKDLLEKLARARSLSPEEEKLKAYWEVGMDGELAERLGADPVMEELARIDALESRKELPELVARLHRLGVDVFWTYAVEADLKRSDTHILDLFQAGLGMPDRDYYLKGDAKSRKLRQEYLKAVARHLRLAGWNASEAAAAAKAVLGIETRLAKASMSAVELRDIEGMYHKVKLAKLGKMANVDWKAYFAALGIPQEKVRSLIACQPKFLAECARIMRTVPLEEIRAYLSWQLVQDAAPYLNDAFVKASFAFFGKALAGKKEMRPRWKRVVAELNGHVGFLLGKRYVKEHFPESAKKRVDALIDDLFDAYRARMTALPWISVRTMARALEKMRAIRRKVGYPKKWRSYAAFRPDASSFLAMHWAAVAFHVERTHKRLGKKVNRNEWDIQPQVVNAFYDPPFNEIVFPAAILQKPFFDKDWSDALNYGAIGAVIGHELTHAFDDQGAGFDKDGNLRNWWTAADKRRFKELAQGFVRQYGKHEVVDGLRCNGELTLGENIADVGGLAIAYDALARKLGGRMHVRQGRFTPAQAFFIGYAQTEAQSIRPEEQRRRVIMDPHAPSVLRVNVACSNLQEFHDAFDIRPGDRLYRKPADRVGIW